MWNNQLMDELQRADDVRCPGLKLVERHERSYFWLRDSRTRLKSVSAGLNPPSPNFEETAQAPRKQ